MNHTPVAQQQRNPLEIPEVVRNLGRFISCSREWDHDYRDLFRALLVCKTWYYALLPSLYEVYSLTKIWSIKSGWSEPRHREEAVKNHRQFVRTLNLLNGLTNTHFPNLEILSVHFWGDGWRDPFTDIYIPILERHATHLRTIALWSVPLDNAHRFAAVLGQMPKLTELAVLWYCRERIIQSPDAMLKIILSCQKLERLRVSLVSLRSSPSLALQSSTKLVHLTYLCLFSVDAESVATMVSHCPSLKTLSWRANGDRRQHEAHEYMRAIIKAIRQCCPKLEHIEELELFQGAEGEDAWFLADLVRSVKQLRTFTTTHNYHVPWSHDLLKALLAHQDTLEVIRTPTGTVSPWMRIKRGRKIDPTLALLPSTAVSVLNNTEEVCEQTSSWSLPPITVPCSKQPSVVSTLLYQCSRLRIVELPYVGLEHFGGLSQQYGGQAWKCRTSLQQLIFTRAQHMIHLSLKRLSKHKNSSLEPGSNAESEVVAEQLQACHLTEEDNVINDNTAKAQRVQAMMDDLAQQLKFCPRLRLFSVCKQEYKSFR